MSWVPFIHLGLVIESNPLLSKESVNEVGTEEKKEKEIERTSGQEGRKGGGREDGGRKRGGRKEGRAEEGRTAGLEKREGKKKEGTKQERMLELVGSSQWSSTFLCCNPFIQFFRVSLYLPLLTLSVTVSQQLSVSFLCVKLRLEEFGVSSVLGYKDVGNKDSRRELWGVATP